MPNLKQEINTKLQNAGELNAGYANTDIAAVIGNVVLTLLTLLGVVFIVLIVYAGFRWMLAKGEDQKITEARNLIIHSIIGLLIVLAAYAISYFIISALQEVV